MGINAKCNWLDENNRFTKAEILLVVKLCGSTDETIDKMCIARYNMDFRELVIFTIREYNYGMRASYKQYKEEINEQ